MNAARSLTTETCVACAAGCHEDDTCLELMRCACPCHGPHHPTPDDQFVLALARATRRRELQIRTNLQLMMIDDLQVVAHAYHRAARNRYHEAETLFRIALETDLLIEFYLEAAA